MSLTPLLFLIHPYGGTIFKSINHHLDMTVPGRGRVKCQVNQRIFEEEVVGVWEF